MQKCGTSSCEPPMPQHDDRETVKSQLQGTGGTMCSQSVQPKPKFRSCGFPATMMSPTSGSAAVLRGREFVQNGRHQYRMPIRGSSPPTRPGETAQNLMQVRPVQWTRSGESPSAAEESRARSSHWKPSLNMLSAKSGKVLAATQTDFAPDGFRSSNPTMPASQSLRADM